MTKPTTAAECIRTPIRLKPASKKEKCCRFCKWWHGDGVKKP